ncbi:resolvase, N-terminal domain protein [Blautia obeum ATCC 29174]|uniref:Resolvase, N-terminal domain protein n=10 Tax=Clostridia TaxID=186801 RepID=A5ZNT5_9FIRM|nr:resolvase, N-terminal domain protein [Blautia obeum ATCC 29174]
MTEKKQQHKKKRGKVQHIRGSPKKRKISGKAVFSSESIPGKMLADVKNLITDKVSELKRADQKKLFLANFPYLMFAYFFNKIAWLYRVNTGATSWDKFMNTITYFELAFQNLWPSLNHIDLLCGIAGGVAVKLIIIYRTKNARKYRLGVEYGSARWGTEKDIRPYADPEFENNIILTETESLTMSSRPKNPKYARNKNILVIGGSGSGKTRFFVKPNIMQMHSSYVITDPKGTVLLEVGSMLAKGSPMTDENGKIVRDKEGKVIYEPYKIKVLNTINFKKSMHYNPFVYIRSEKDILKLVTTIIANTKGEGQQSGEDFWVKAEKLYYCALIGYIWYEGREEEKNFNTLLEMINVSEAREDDENFKNPVDLMFDELEQKDPNHFAVRQYKKYKLAAGVVCSKRLLNQAVGKSLRTHNLKPKKGAQVMRKNEKITALYERLSRDDFGKDDDQQRESNSISNQKAMLEEFAARQGFTNIVHFTDDGISGTCFDRPGFLAMMKEVEAGNVEYLCIKDMSRMGRDYLKVGQIMEILRQRGVRLIAINDGVDSARGDDDFTPFRNIMNEYYARDTSRKIRSTFQSKGKSGKHLTGTVIYGYLWNEARDQWLVDPEAAEVVKRIFAMTIEGYGPYQIASKLKEEKILIPSAYLAQHGEGVNKNKTFKDVYGWGSSTICNLLEKREYLGHTINFKTRKHFKDKKSHYVPEDEWTIFENTHEAIIDQQTFDLVQKIRGNVRRYPDGWGEAAPLTGLLYCADCGGKMYVHRTNNGKRISQYTCSQYSKVPVGKLCTTQHRINEDVVLSLVSEMLKAIAEYAKHDRAEFVRVVQEAQSSQQTAEVKKQRTRLATAKQRVSELEVLLCKIYEDNILGKLSDSRYATLDAQYEKEQSELTAEISVLEKAVKSYEKHEKDADRFIALIDKYENFDKLTIAMLNEFIEKILVHERDRKGSIQTTQEVEIYFNFVGRFVPPAFGEVELTPEELEEIRKREERKDRLHQNYLKRKASGAQKRYEDKIKGRKKAEIEAKKAAIRAEDIAKGVFVPVSSLPQREPMKGVQTA